ncbi:lecithin retinol acyltransferase family protein [Robiginitomaculum antarcticum]|uniref:lecithin retinol acyltransferase family protein n=1 Tax=Robiginitomaculum antarcticum TaxID=437507 RepID=UPI0003711BC8|nr:lecithin retinol acyltransferase family protein [Robiginitomaculum antarcticum]
MTNYPFERGPVYPAGTLLEYNFMGGLRHFGIATGYGTVIHSSRRLGGVLESDFNEFSDGRSVRVVPLVYPVSGAELVARARAKTGQRYNVLTRNCEHFVTWVLEGRPRSRQLGPLSR